LSLSLSLSLSLALALALTLALAERRATRAETGQRSLALRRGEAGQDEHEQGGSEGTEQHPCKQPRRGDSGKMTQRLFIFGLGYSGLAIAAAAQANGWSVAGTVRTPAKAENLRKRGIEAHVFDGTRPIEAAALGQDAHVVCTIAPGSGGDPALGASAAALRGARWLGYLSTTGVYGDRGGDWVDEDTPPRPAQPRSIERLATEQAWQALGRESGAPVTLFRLPGIYGPGRSALDQVRSGGARRIDKPGQVFSRIHVEDIAGAVMAALARGAEGGVFNVADDLPAPSGDVVAFACELLGVAVPPTIPWEEAEPTLSAMARSFYAESRRVRNDRMKRVLGVVLLYPTYREGLRAIAGTVPR
jgi:nucleoside-diphosphate-sugar epimerase